MQCWKYRIFFFAFSLTFWQILALCLWIQKNCCDVDAAILWVKNHPWHLCVCRFLSLLYVLFLGCKGGRLLWFVRDSSNFLKFLYDESVSAKLNDKVLNEIPKTPCVYVKPCIGYTYTLTCSVVFYPNKSTILSTERNYNNYFTKKKLYECKQRWLLFIFVRFSDII